MKANEAPEKIYLANTEYRTLEGWHKKPFAINGIECVEYTCTDAFIKKAEEYLYKQLNEGNMECGDIETFIEDFKNYMKGE